MDFSRRVEEWIKLHSTAVFTFLFTFVSGTFIHLYMFTNKFYNYFEMNNILTPMSFDKGDTLAMGRWFLPLVSRLSSVFSMPVINGMICLLCLSVSACLIADIFGIQSRVMCALTGGILVSFPGVASYLSYGVNCDVFAVSILFAVLSGWFILKKRTITCSVIGGVFLALCIATYQPFMAVTIAIIYGKLFLDVLFEKTGFTDFLKKFARYLIILAASFVLYYVILKIVTMALGITVGDYHGIDEMASFTIKGIAKGTVYTYLYFIRYFFTAEYAGSFILIGVNVLLAILFIIMVVLSYRDGGKEGRGKGNLLTLILMILVLPIGVNAPPFLMADRVGNGVDRYMMFSIMVLFILLVAFLDRCKGVILPAVGTCLLVLEIICCAYICNQGYFRAEAMTVSENNLLNRLGVKLEEDDRWNSDMPTFFGGCEELFNSNSYMDIDAFNNLPVIDGTEIKDWYNFDAVVKYMNTYMNFDIMAVDEMTRDSILITPEYKSMPLYPEKGSMDVIDGVYVVKFKEPDTD